MDASKDWWSWELPFDPTVLSDLDVEEEEGEPWDWDRPRWREEEDVRVKDAARVAAGQHEEVAKGSSGERWQEQDCTRFVSINLELTNEALSGGGQQRLVLSGNCVARQSFCGDKAEGIHALVPMVCKEGSRFTLDLVEADARKEETGIILSGMLFVQDAISQKLMGCFVVPEMLHVRSTCIGVYEYRVGQDEVVMAPSELCGAMTELQSMLEIWAEREEDANSEARPEFPEYSSHVGGKTPSVGDCRQLDSSTESSFELSSVINSTDGSEVAGADDSSSLRAPLPGFEDSGATPARESATRHFDKIFDELVLSTTRKDVHLALIQDKLLLLRRKIDRRSWSRTPAVRFEDLTPLFVLTREEIANGAGVCLTLFKRVIKRLGINRWPSRKYRQMQRRVSHLTQKYRTRIEKSSKSKDEKRSVSSMSCCYALQYREKLEKAKSDARSFINEF